MDALKVNWVLSVYICRTGIGPVSLYSVHRDRLSIPIADLTRIFGSPAAIAVPLDEGHVGAVRYARQPQSEKIVGQ